MKAKRPAGTVCLKVAARILAKRGIDTDPRRIFAQLRSCGMLDGSHASDAAFKAGWLLEETGYFQHGAGGDDSYTRVFITGEGIAECCRKLKLRWLPDCDIELGVPKKCKLGF